MDKLIITMCLLLTVFNVQGEAQKLTADEIVKKANDVAFYAGKDLRMTVRMEIKSQTGALRKREFVILRYSPQKGKDQKFYIYFKAPADVRKMAYLVWKHVDEQTNDDRWLWLPALNLKKRIAPGDKRTSFAGSNFFYEDVSGRSLNADTHQLIETTTSQYRVRNIPKKSESVEFAYYDVLINKETFLPVRMDYYNQQGKKIRTMQAVKVKTISGFPTIVESRVDDLIGGGSTTSYMSDIRYNIGLTDRLFTARYLKRPPRELRK
jgi:hypothetical protein